MNTTDVMKKATHSCGVRGEPLIIDGRTTTHSYLVCAARAEADAWNALVIKYDDASENSIKCKFYPTVGFSVEDRMLKTQFHAENFRDRTIRDMAFPASGYQRFYLKAPNLVKMLEYLTSVEGFIVAPAAMVFKKMHVELNPEWQSFVFDGDGKRQNKQITNLLADNPPTEEETVGRKFVKHV